MKKIAKVLNGMIVLGLVTSLTACGSTTNNQDTTSEKINEESLEVSTNEELDSENSIYSADVIIVGAGGAGMTAAIEAQEAGASVIILEKSSSVGGNTVATQSGMNAVGTEVQEEAGFEDSKEEFILEQTNDYTNEELVKFFADNSADAITWLESLGMVFAINTERNGYTHFDANGNTTALTVVDTIYSKLKDKETTILFNTTATSLIEEDGMVVGVAANDADGNELQFYGNAVVIATGGYGQNSELVYENNESLTGAITDEIAPTTGDGLIMAQALGAATVDMDKFTTFPVVETTTHQMIFPMFVPGDGIFVNSEGNRFASEAFGDETVMNATMAEENTYIIFDQANMDKTAVFQDLYNRGVVVEGATIEELAENLDMNVDNLQTTVDQWNNDVNAGEDSTFSRDMTKVTNDITNAPYYAVSFGVGVHYCLGGLLINTNTQVIDVDGNIIEGLYAAGEVTGGVHGDNKVDGSTFADSIIFGRQTGLQSAEYALSKGTKELVVPTTNKEETIIQVQGNYDDGIYEGTGVGRGGDIKLQVTVEEGNIVDITILENEETASIFEGVETNIISNIISNQSVDVDVISGATLSSNGVLEAVENALSSTK